ncbi:kinase-like protein [Hyaloscypha bicolor E]|uniref:non-specific serine/threonine protein kinase n=1 Tax=Hyaloscypha bicolor E TaxID=1095630 RepID=A0A2J6T684_9HELO|nr:kinase-like protein [Hyaloscypha bicolor E]PMD58532.1 kinase-like protein [Hyaloscypha bicolor E]
MKCSGKGAPPQNPQSQHPKDKEEGISCYKPDGFHPVRISEIFNNSYIVIRKLGRGRCSSIWLVQDFFTSAEKKYAMKVLGAECCGTGDRNHPGYEHVSILHDLFTYKGPNGDHICLIFDLYWFDERKIPTPLVQKFMRQLLQALEYAHERGVIHTDIYVKEGYNLMNLNIALSDWGVASFINRRLTEEIQPLLLRTPGVLLSAPWDEKVDIWNLGALVPELVFGQNMFSAEDKKGVYSGDQGVVSEVFDEEGNVKVKELDKVVRLEKRFEGMDVKERRKFVAFVGGMLVLDPARRPSAKELLGDEWLKHNYDESFIEEEL